LAATSNRGRGRKKEKDRGMCRKSGPTWENFPARVLGSGSPRRKKKGGKKREKKKILWGTTKKFNPHVVVPKKKGTPGVVCWA